MLIRTAFIVTLQILTAMIVAPAPAEGRGASSTVPELREVIAGFPRAWLPQYGVDEEGNPIGFAIEVMNEIAALTGVHVTYLAMDNWAEVEKALQDGRIDLIPNGGITPERSKTTLFTSPVETFAISIFVRSNTSEIRGLLDLFDHRVAVVGTNIGFSLLEDREGIDLAVYRNLRSALFSLLAGQVNALVYPQSVVFNLARQIGVEDRIKLVGAPIKEIRRGIALRMDHTELLGVMNKAVETFVGSPAYRAIYVKWYGKPAPYWTVNRLAWAMSGAVLAILIVMALWRYWSVVALNKALQSAIIVRKRAEEALRKSEERFRAVVNNSPTKIHIKDNAGRYVLINRHAEKLFGVTDEEARGKTTDEIFPRGITAAIEGHDRAVLDTGQTVEQEEIWPSESGTRTYLTVKFPILCADGRIGGVGAIGTDITERKRAERAQEASEAKLAGILDIAPQAVISIGRDRHIQLFNQGAEAIFGYAAEEVIGECIDMLLPSHLRERHAKHIEDFARSPNVSYLSKERAQIVGLRRDGTEFPADGSISKLDQGGETIFTLMLRDITERKEAEDRVLAAKAQAEIANRAKSEFLANMSHELRTPLNAIIGFSDMIRGETFGPVGSPKYIEYVKDINESGTHLLALINDILDLSKIEAGKVELHEEAIDVSKVVGSCLHLVKERAEAAKVILKMDIADGLPPLYADERKLKQILINLLSNAIKFTPAGGRVTIKSWTRPDDGYVFQVADTGIGIALEDIPKALAPFQQIDSDLNRKYEGTGLGLPLTKSLVELHGGSLDLQSEADVGTTVTVRFPAERIVLEAATGA